MVNAVRRTTVQEEFDRFAENLFGERGRFIRDRSTFDQQFDSFMEGEDLSNKRNTILRQKAFDIIQKRHPDFVDKRNLFKVAGGKNLKRDQARTAKVIAKTPEEFIKKTAQKSDLARLDTTKQFSTLAFRKQVRVFSRREMITVRGKQVVRFRDKQGRFVRKI